MCTGDAYELEHMRFSFIVTFKNSGDPVRMDVSLPLLADERWRVHRRIRQELLID